MAGAKTTGLLAAALLIMASLLLAWPSCAADDPEDSSTYTDCRLTAPLEVEPVWPVPIAAEDFDCEGTSDEAETWEA